VNSPLWDTELTLSWGGAERFVPLTNWAGRCYPSFPSGDEYLARVFNLTPADRVLDVGGGAEPFQSATVVCEKELRATSQRAGRGMSADRRLVGAAAEALPFANDSFDFAFSRHVFEHVSDPRAASKEVMRVASRGYIETPNALSEYLVGDPTHRWLVRATEQTLIFTPRPFVEHPFGNVLRWLLHTDRELYFRWEMAYRNLTNTQFYWEDAFEVVVEESAATDFQPNDMDHRLRSLLDFASNGVAYDSANSADVIAAITSALALAPDHPGVGPLAGYAHPLRYAGEVLHPERITREALVMGTAEGQHLGGGWFGVEHWPPAVRWTGPEAVAYLRRSSEREFAMRLFTGPAQLNRAVTGTVYVNETLHPVTLEAGSWADLSFPLPTAAGEIVTVGMRWDTPWSPRELLGSPDTRQLGVAVHELRLKYET
jgi:hypothetical protein